MFKLRSKHYKRAKKDNCFFDRAQYNQDGWKINYNGQTSHSQFVTVHEREHCMEYNMHKAIVLVKIRNNFIYGAKSVSQFLFFWLNPSLIKPLICSVEKKIHSIFRILPLNLLAQIVELAHFLTNLKKNKLWFFRCKWHCSSEKYFKKFNLRRNHELEAPFTTTAFDSRKI
jgi:hypothetical protein